jgi:hypothetical protein
MGGDVEKVQEAVEFVLFDGCLLSYTLCNAVLVCSFEGQILAGLRHDGRGDGKIAVQTDSSARLRFGSVYSSRLRWILCRP